MGAPATKRGGPLGGRVSVRSVAVGMVVSLVVAVVLPLVAILGVLPAVSGSHDLGIPPGSTAAAVASDLQHDLAVLGSTATKTAADAGLRQQLAAASTAAPVAAATKALAAGATAVGPAVVRLALSDASGKVRITWSGEA